MNIEPKYKEIIVKEFDYAFKKMKASSDPDETLYYFTAFFNTLNRVYNLHYSDDLLFAFIVMENAYNFILERNRIKKSGENTINFHEKFGTKFIQIVRNIKDGFFQKTKRLAALQELAVIAYSTTGNGQYLTEKGDITIFKDLDKAD